MPSRRLFSIFVLISFFLTSLGPIPQAYAQGVSDLPVPGTMVNLSPAFEPVLMKGIKVHPENPFLFDFIIDTGNSGLDVGARYAMPLRQESEKLIKYFLAAMTVPEKDLWVNLSPYEKDRMIAPNLGQTEMGRDMLAQDYILKQLTASLIYPEKNLGKTFWDKVYAKAQQLYGTTQIPLNTFNKVWIVADRADVFERANVAYVVGTHLKVMMEEDYLSLEKHSNVGAGHAQPVQGIDQLGSQIVRSIILPELEKEVNQGKNFAPLRQMFYSMILASWYKIALKDALVTQIYGNQSKVKVGVNVDNPTEKDQIFQRYLQAYKKGVFNYIKEDMDQTTQQITPRKYFSGGLGINVPNILHRLDKASPAMLGSTDKAVIVQVAVYPGKTDAAMQNPEQEKVPPSQQIKQAKEEYFRAVVNEQNILPNVRQRLVGLLLDAGYQRPTILQLMVWNNFGEEPHLYIRESSAINETIDEIIKKSGVVDPLKKFEAQGFQTIKPPPRPDVDAAMNSRQREGTRDVRQESSRQQQQEPYKFVGGPMTESPAKTRSTKASVKKSSVDGPHQDAAMTAVHRKLTPEEQTKVVHQSLGIILSAIQQGQFNESISARGVFQLIDEQLRRIELLGDSPVERYWYYYSLKDTIKSIFTTATTLRILNAATGKEMELEDLKKDAEGRKKPVVHHFMVGGVEILVYVPEVEEKTPQYPGMFSEDLNLFLFSILNSAEFHRANVIKDVQGIIEGNVKIKAVREIEVARRLVGNLRFQKGKWEKVEDFYIQRVTMRLLTYLVENNSIDKEVFRQVMTPLQIQYLSEQVKDMQESGPKAEIHPGKVDMKTPALALLKAIYKRGYMDNMRQFINEDMMPWKEITDPAMNSRPAAEMPITLQGLQWSDIRTKGTRHIFPTTINAMSAGRQHFLYQLPALKTFNSSGQDHEQLRYYLSGKNGTRDRSDQGITLSLKRIQKKEKEDGVTEQRWAFSLTMQERRQLETYLQDDAMNSPQKIVSEEFVQKVVVSLRSKKLILVIEDDDDVWSLYRIHYFEPLAEINKGIEWKRVKSRKGVMDFISKPENEKNLGLVITDNQYPLEDDGFIIVDQGFRLEEELRRVFSDLPVLLTSVRDLSNMASQKGINFVLKENLKVVMQQIAQDLAMAAKMTPGGIDLDRNKMQMNIKRDGPTIKIDQAVIERIRREGFDGLEFKIQSMVPVTNLPLILGLSTQQSPLQQLIPSVSLRINPEPSRKD